MSTKRLLAVTLTEAEIADRGRMAAALAQEQTRLEEERKASDTKYRERIGGMKSRIAAVQTEIREGSKLVEIPVGWRTDFHRNVKELIRLDTGDIVETEALSAEERQGELFMFDADKDAKENAA